jgi:hypothetical protein
LVVVGNIDRAYFDMLVTSAERLLKKKIRAAVYGSEEFGLTLMQEASWVCVYVGK